MRFDLIAHANRRNPVNHSFSQSADLTCPECHRAFTAELWLIVDAAERPDLLEHIRAGTLHDVTCPDVHQEMLHASPIYHHI